MTERVSGAMSSLRTRWGWAAITVLVAIRLATPHTWLGTTVYLTALCGAAVVAVVAVFRFGPPRLARGLLAAGIVCTALGDVIWQIYVTVTGASPDVSLADIPWLAAYVLVGAALWTGPTGRRPRISDDPDAVIDMSVVAVISSLVVWHLWVEPMVSDSSTPVYVRLVWAAYPVLDAALLALLVRTLLDRSRTRVVAGFVAAGVGCWLLSDLGFLVLGEESALAPLMDAGWMLGTAALAAATWRLHPDPAENDAPARTRADRADASETTAPTAGSWRIALALVPLLVPWVFELVAYAQGTDTDPLPLFLATAALAGLVFVRTLRLLRIGRDSRARLEASERLYRSVAAHSSDAALVLDGRGVLLRPAPSLGALFRTDGVSEVGTDVLALAEDVDGFGADIRKLFDKSLASPGEDMEGEFCVRVGDSSYRWFDVRIVNLQSDPDVDAVLANLHDVTDRKRAEEALTHQAFHDMLTGLPNRALFRDRLDHTLLQAMRTGNYPVVLYIDLDGFKHVNDSLGHDAGDDLLIEVTRRTSSIVRAGDTVARLGGDEFAVLVEQSGDALLEARVIANRLLEALLVPVQLGNRAITMSASIGIAPATPDSTAGSLLRDADTAMYRAKTNGRSRWIEYEPAMRAAAVKRLQIESDLHLALPAGQLRVEYQPVIDLTTRAVVGFEALLRWAHPTLGEITPDVFIPIAEEAGLIVDIGRWVLDTACRQAARWQRRFGTERSMAVNVSGRQLSSPDLYGDVRDALAMSGLDPTLLVLEITETALIEDAPTAVAVLERLRLLGIRLAVDDFGTGYSSLSHLRQFPIDIIKIDQSFVGIIGSDGEIPDIVRGLLELARTLHLQTVAEGIESDDQLQQLRQLHCDQGQGFLFAKSLPPTVAGQLLEEQARHDSDDPRVPPATVGADVEWSPRGESNS
jgi:diguanylate cyclase (GGDEF)-like protein/PAS domain S-box-containing protein